MALQATLLHAAQIRHAQYYLSRLAQANLLYNQGGDARREGKAIFDVDWSQIQQGHATLKASDDHDALTVCVRIGIDGYDLLRLRQSVKDHLAWLEAGLDAARTIRDAESERIYLYNIAHALFSANKNDDSYDMTAAGLALARAQNDPAAIAFGLSHMAGCRMRTGQFDEAEAYLQEAESFDLGPDDAFTTAHVYTNYGLVKERQGDYDAAKTYTERALACHEQLGLQRRQADMWDNLGVLAWRQGDVQGARECWDKALALDMAGEHIPGMVGRYNNLGAAAYIQGDLHGARHYFLEGSRLLDSFDRPRQLAILLCNLGEVDGKIGDFESAVAHTRKAMQLARQIPAYLVLVDTLRNTAAYQLELGDPAAARANIIDGLHLRQHLNPAYIAKLMLGWSAMLNHEADYPGAARVVGLVASEKGSSDSEIKQILDEQRTALADHLDVATLEKLYADGAACGLDAMIDKILNDHSSSTIK